MPFANPFLMVVMLVLTACVVGTINNSLRARRNAGATDVDASEMEQELAYLRDRIHVLERLATDPEEDLRDRFRRLD
ncbi:MAG: hypothetical protein AAFO63_08690 [Pseudomonadota bacterium]